MPRPLVFVLMSQRSGTSALVHTLNAHPGAAVGIERYKFLWKTWPHAWDASLFEAERFLSPQPDETNILGSERWDTYYRDLADAWGPDTLSGDKLQPITTELVRGMLRVAPQARFLYPFRQLLPLASSYEVRAADTDDPNWHPGRGADAGLEVWQHDNREVLLMLEDPELAPAVLPIAYEDFFRGDPVTVAAVLEHVGLAPDPAFSAAVEANATRYERVQGKPLALSYEQVARLLPHAHDDVHAELQRRAPSSSVREPDADDGAVARAARLELRVAALEHELTRLRSRRSVRAALAAVRPLNAVRTLVRRRVGDG